MALPADVDFSFSTTVFLSTSKAAGIKLALLSITRHQRHLTDAEEQRFGVDVGKKLSNALSSKTGEEARWGGWAFIPGVLHGHRWAAHPFSPVSVLANPCGGFTSLTRKANGHFSWCQVLREDCDLH